MLKLNFIFVLIFDSRKEQPECIILNGLKSDEKKAKTGQINQLESVAMGLRMHGKILNDPSSDASSCSVEFDVSN